MCDLPRGDETTQRLGITAFVDELSVALTNARVYPSDHPRALHSIGALRRCLGDLSSATNASPVVLGTTDGLLFYKQKALVRASLSSSRMIEALAACGAGALSIEPHVGDQDVIALIEVLSQPKRNYASIHEANADLAKRGSASIQFLPEYRALKSEFQIPDAPDSDPPKESTPFEVPLVLYQQTVGLLQDSMVRISHGEELDLDGARGCVEAIRARLAREAASMMGLARYERHDAYTFGHSIRVCFLALNFASVLFEREDVLQSIGLAALLHDVGKARVPFEVLHSTSKLTPEERIEMNKHTIHGGEILLGVSRIDSLAVSTAFGHHQTIGGAGYPATLHPVRQSLGTRIVKICDVYEALTAVRPYKARMSPVRAYRVMISMKDHFDTALLRRFIEVNGIYPIGTLVKLSTGEHARVLDQTTSPLLPIVRTEVEDTNALDRGPGVVKDLSTESAGPDACRVAEVLDDAA